MFEFLYDTVIITGHILVFPQFIILKWRFKVYIVLQDFQL